MISSDYVQTECVICNEYIEVDRQEYDVQDGDYAHISCLKTVGFATFEPEEEFDYDEMEDDDDEINLL